MTSYDEAASDRSVAVYEVVRELWGVTDVWAGPLCAGKPRKLLSLVSGRASRPKLVKAPALPKAAAAGY